MSRRIAVALAVGSLLTVGTACGGETDHATVVGRVAEQRIEDQGSHLWVRLDWDAIDEEWRTVLRSFAGAEWNPRRSIQALRERAWEDFREGVPKLRGLTEDEWRTREIERWREVLQNLTKDEWRAGEVEHWREVLQNLTNDEWRADVVEGWRRSLRTHTVTEEWLLERAEDTVSNSDVAKTFSSFYATNYILPITAPSLETVLGNVSTVPPGRVLRNFGRPIRFSLVIVDPRLGAAYDLAVSVECFETVEIGDPWPYSADACR